MAETDRIINRIRRTVREGDAWHGSCVEAVLSDITQEQAAAKPIPDAHSIWTLVLHISAWVDTVRRRVEGENVELSDDEDWPRVRDISPAAWDAVRRELVQAHDRLAQAVAQLDDDRLDDHAIGDQPDLYIQINGVIEHTLYHAGQIALLKKMKI